MTQEQVIRLLEKQRDKYGSARKLADAIGCSVVYVCDVFNGRRPPGPSILGWLGIQKVVTYTYRRTR